MPNYISSEARVSKEAILEEPVRVEGRTIGRTQTPNRLKEGKKC